MLKYEKKQETIAQNARCHFILTINIKRFGNLPLSLLESINALEKDEEFLIKYNIFPEWLINKWIENKKKEFFEVENNPSSIEFIRYFYL